MAQPLVTAGKGTVNYRDKRLWLGGLGIVGSVMFTLGLVPPVTPPVLIVGVLLMLPGLAYLGLVVLYRLYLWTR